MSGPNHPYPKQQLPRTTLSRKSRWATRTNNGRTNERESLEKECVSSPNREATKVKTPNAMGNASRLHVAMLQQEPWRLQHLDRKRKSCRQEKKVSKVDFTAHCLFSEEKERNKIEATRRPRLYFKSDPDLTWRSGCQDAQWPKMKKRSIERGHLNAHPRSCEKKDRDSLLRFRP